MLFRGVKLKRVPHFLVYSFVVNFENHLFIFNPSHKIPIKFTSQFVVALLKTFGHLNVNNPIRKAK